MTDEQELIRDLAEALKDVMGWINNWSPSFTEDEEWEETEKQVDAVLFKAREYK